jgi:hypothetical protein
MKTLKFEEIAQALYGGTSTVETDVTSQKILTSALTSLLLQKGFITKQELEERTDAAFHFHESLRKRHLN